MANHQQRDKSRSGLEWPIGIALVLLAFLTFLIGSLVYLSGEHFDLVTSDYYEEGLAYQQRIDAINRTRAIPEALTIKYNKAEKALIFRFAPTFLNTPIKGTIYLYRPSNAQLDKYVTLPETLQTDFIVPTESLSTGKWRIKTTWEVNGLQYYDETIVYIQ